MSSNVGSFLKTAGNLIKGELANINEELKQGKEKRQGVLWQVLCNLLVYAQNGIFKEGYTRKLAKQFLTEVVEETGLSQKQAAKYTEAISAGLGVRGVRKGFKPIAGLPAACESVKLAGDFLKAAEIDTFNKFRSAVREDKSPVRRVAEALHKLTDKQRTMAIEMAKKLDRAEDTEETE